MNVHVNKLPDGEYVHNWTSLDNYICIEYNNQNDTLEIIKMDSHEQAVGAKKVLDKLVNCLNDLDGSFFDKVEFLAKNHNDIMSELSNYIPTDTITSIISNQ
ncbi:TPA: hypothetical protein ROX91_002008 [Bacillus cereus]|nr:hypothetical protein [Bacillus cereus]